MFHIPADKFTPSEHFDALTKTRVTDAMRLSPEAYASLVKQCPGIAVTNETSPMQAGWQLGAQHVLKLLREGFVLERQ